MLRPSRKLTLLTESGMQLECKWWEAYLYPEIWKADPTNLGAVLVIPTSGSNLPDRRDWGVLRKQILTLIDEKASKYSDKIVVPTSGPFLDLANPNMLYGDGIELRDYSSVHYVLRPHKLGSPSSKQATGWVKDAQAFAERKFADDEAPVLLSFCIEHTALSELMQRVAER